MIDRDEKNIAIGSSGVVVSKRCLLFDRKGTTVSINELLVESVSFTNGSAQKATICFSGLEQSDLYELEIGGKQLFTVKKSQVVNVAFNMRLKKTCNLFIELPVEICRTFADCVSE